ncbi:MAG: sigma-70 family RNA polymerase sigma factor [Clostridia bacterium]|nr:sigma-70 family RNA polymerase sigma factor [Clostridia bacterium]
MDSSDKVFAMTDEELLALIRSGSESAFSVLAERYANLTESAVRGFSPSFSVAEGNAVWGEDDLRQCASLALYRAAMTYDPEKSGREVRFGLYAKICVNNALISELRKVRAEATRRARRGKRKEPGRSGDPLDEIVSAEGVSGLVGSISRVLSPFEKEVFDRYITGMSVEQIAQLLGKDRKSVSNALYRMKVKIKGLLQNHS